MTRPLELRARSRTRKTRERKAAGRQKGASIMPTKDHLEWPYVALLVAIVLMIAGALHLLSTWVAFVIFAVLWVGFAIWSKTHR